MVINVTLFWGFFILLISNDNIIGFPVAYKFPSGCHVLPSAREKKNIDGFLTVCCRYFIVKKCGEGAHKYPLDENPSNEGFQKSHLALSYPSQALLVFKKSLAIRLRFVPDHSLSRNLIITRNSVNYYSL